MSSEMKMHLHDYTKNNLSHLSYFSVFIEKLEEDVGKYLPEVSESSLSDQVVKIDLNAMSMAELRQKLSEYPVKTRLSLTGKQKNNEQSAFQYHS